MKVQSILERTHYGQSHGLILRDLSEIVDYNEFSTSFLFKAIS